MNKYISIKRLGMLFKHDWTTYWKDKAWLCILLFMFLFFAYLLADKVNFLAGLFFSFSVFLMALSPAVFASRIFSNMRTKQQRISFLMLPATRPEKYIVRFVDYAIVPTLLIVFVTMLAALVILAIEGDFAELVKVLAKLKVAVSGIEELHDRLPLIILLGVTSWLANISVIVLGGTVFGRYAVVKTFVVCLAIGIIAPDFTPWGVHLHFSIGDKDDVFGLLGNIVIYNILQTLVFVAVSYFLYRRKQVI